MKWVKTKFKGVRYRLHPTRKHGIQPDRYYALHYKLDGKVHDEPVGWASEGWNAEKAALKLAELRGNRKDGSGPRTLKESREVKEAERAAEQARLKLEAAAAKTLSEYWQETYLPAIKRSKNVDSWVKEEQHFRIWIEPLLGRLCLKSISLPQWDELVKTLSSADMSPRSKEYITGTLRRILKHAYDRRLVDDPPPTGKRIGVTGPGNNRRLRVISGDEENAILEQLAITDPHAWRVTRFALLTGARVSEVFNLRWAGVDFGRSSVTFVETKNGETRTLPMSPHVSELLGTSYAIPPQPIHRDLEDAHEYGERSFFVVSAKELANFLESFSDSGRSFDKFRFGE